MASKIRFKDDEIRLKLAAASPKARFYLNRITALYAARSEAYARINANWRDRTGNARQGLGAEADLSGVPRGRWAITIFHQVRYGIWLEVRFAGRHAIIGPTIRVQGEAYLRDARRIMREMFG